MLVKLRLRMATPVPPHAEFRNDQFVGQTKTVENQLNLIVDFGKNFGGLLMF